MEVAAPVDRGERVRTFSATDQLAFAAVSGDTNPMHLDAVAARRTQAGAVVVHGVHGVLWALETMLATSVAPPAFGEIEVRFRRFVYVDADVELRIERLGDATRLILRSDGLDCTIIDVRPVAGEVVPKVDEGPLLALGAPRSLSIEEIATEAGRLLCHEHEMLAAFFPHCVISLGPTRVQGISLLSTVVGVVCPGLHSIFDGFTIRLEETTHGSELSYSVVAVDDRFRSVALAVRGPGFSGSVRAFVRHPPARIAGLDVAARLVAPGEFDGINALIVGGSRGLGAATAKLIVAGGGSVVVTYRVGVAEARELCDELGADHCSMFPYDASLPAVDQLPDATRPYEHVYYFATAPIFREPSSTFSAARLQTFLRLYADGFAELFEAVRDIDRRGARTAFFYPSTVFVAERPKKMTEYAMAKAAGEILAVDLERSDRNARILVERLPRVETDQTASIIPVEVADALVVMAPVVRRMRRAFEPRNS